VGEKWKKDKGKEVWRGSKAIMSTCVKKLTSAVEKEVSDTVKIAGFGVVYLTKEKVQSERPPDFILQWMKECSTLIGGMPLFLQVAVPVNGSKPHFDAFEFKTLDSEPEKVFLPFLTKRLANEKVFFHDVDVDSNPLSVADLVGEVIYATWNASMHTYIHTYIHEKH